MADEKAPEAAAAAPVAVPVAQASQPPMAVVTGAGGAPIPRGDQGWYDKIPRRIICQFCGYEVVTATNFQTGLGTHLIAGGTCLVGCIPCCLIPYCVNDFKDVIHSCPNCQRVVGSKRLA